MGNCMQRGRERREEEAMQQQQEEGTKGLVKESVDCVKGGSGGLKVKIVLTKEELQWLMIQLKKNEGKRLEDVLAEIGRERGKVEAWKPSLESIMEGPEVFLRLLPFSPLRFSSSSSFLSSEVFDLDDDPKWLRSE
ncbi:uncharacterized protein LOC116139406 [Pistacia vera]|uniref:uncharacterized protein LOC116139406 n=1 Tax=Pistacia vera TaxID=55513 RepID=UPI001263611D|nr:uncharacterized protein LOC116139406 [Pistacia vera]